MRPIIKLPQKLISFLLLIAQHVWVSSTEEQLLNSRSPSCMIRIRGHWSTASSPCCFCLHRAARRASLTRGWTCGLYRGSREPSPWPPGKPPSSLEGTCPHPSVNMWSIIGVLQCNPVFSLAYAWSKHISLWANEHLGGSVGSAIISFPSNKSCIIPCGTRKVCVYHIIFIWMKSTFKILTL